MAGEKHVEVGTITWDDGTLQMLPIYRAAAATRMSVRGLLTKGEVVAIDAPTLEMALDWAENLEERQVLRRLYYAGL